MVVFCAVITVEMRSSACWLERGGAGACSVVGDGTEGVPIIA